MTRWIVVLLALSFSASLLAQEPPPRRDAPYFDARRHAPEYVGPGRELSEPEGVTEVALAYFGPPDAEHPEWGEAWRGATLAIEHANATGGYGGVPFRLVPAWSENPWGSGVSRLARAVYAEGVLAILGGVDGVTTHLAEQIVAKARLAQVSFGNTDSSVHLTNVPWVFTLPATDDAAAPVVVKLAMTRAGQGGRWCAVTATDHDSRATWSEIDSALTRHNAVAPALHLQIDPGAAAAAAVASRVTQTGAPVTIVVAQARDAGRIVRALRHGGFAGAIVGGATLGRRGFVREAGSSGEGVLFPLLFRPADAPPEFVADYRARFADEPDWLAVYAFDAASLVVQAVRRAGLNRARIQDALRALVPWPGVGGPVAWDPTGRARRSPKPGTIRDGRPVPAAW